MNAFLPKSQYHHSILLMILDTADPLGPFDMPVASIIAAVMASLHLLAYSTLLGAELYQSFVMTKLAFQSLPRSAFTSLQKRVFPVYFRGQSLLLAVVALTLPPSGPVSLFNLSNSITFAVAGGTALLNLLVYGPRTQQLMIERIHQGSWLPRCYVLVTQSLTIFSHARLDTVGRGRRSQ